MKEKLTLEQFKKISPGDIIEKGILPNSPEGIFMTRDGGNLKWIAIKGYGNDWTIYCHWDYQSDEYVKSNGDKIHTETYIKRCVPCDDDVFDLYRF